jgi:glycosyltransferase involved in cell wall biosynthesis
MEVMHEATASQQWEADVQVRLRLVPAPARNPLIEIVIPVYNEELVLARNIRRLHRYLLESFPFSFIITIADNASTDATLTIARQLAAELAQVRAVHLALKGRGRALRQVWAHSSADVVAYMDVDLSTSLDAFLPLVAPLLSGHSDLAIGSRLSRGSAVVRGRKRELISRGYNLMLHTVMAARFSDAQCGFKAGRTEVVQALLPGVEDDAWFFDTELLLLAENSGLRIHEVPVDWVDDPDSRVNIGQTIRDDLRGMLRVARRSLFGSPGSVRMPADLGRQLRRFAVVGVASTIAQVALFLLLRNVMPALAANAVSLLVTCVLNTAANRRYTFGATGSGRLLRQQLEAGVAFLIGLALSSAGLIALTLAAGPQVGRSSELVTVLGCNAVTTAIRFLLMRAWIFSPSRNALLEQPR